MNLACRWTALAGAAAILLVTAGCASAPRERAPERDTARQEEEPPLARAERLLDAGRLYEAEATLAEIDSSALSARDRHRLRLLRAELSLAAQQPLFALRDLPEPRATPDRALAARTEAVRAETLLAWRRRRCHQRPGHARRAARRPRCPSCQHRPHLGAARRPAAGRKHPVALRRGRPDHARLVRAGADRARGHPGRSRRAARALAQPLPQSPGLRGARHALPRAPRR